MGGHHSAVPGTHVWLTPPHIIEALGGRESFDLDPCAPPDSPLPTALACWTEADNGLIQPWVGRVFLNPPYERPLIGQFLARMVNHGVGVALIFARSETAHYQDLVLGAADALFHIRGRLHFHHPDGRRAKHNCGAPSSLVAYGARDAEILSELALDGHFQPLRFRFMPVIAPRRPGSWAEELARVMRERGSLTVAELYRLFEGSDKIQANRNWKAKLRQALQRGPYRNPARGQWELAA
jgi:hypothetical protein